MTSKNTQPKNVFSQWAWPFTLPGAFSPNPGWTFGNVTINTTNSSSPEAEQGIVSQISYGKQIGRVMEALVPIAKHFDPTGKDPAIKDFLELAQQVEKIKAEYTVSRVEALRQELAALRLSDRKAWDELFKQG
jgi:hypothetical protein